MTMITKEEPENISDAVFERFNEKPENVKETDWPDESRIDIIGRNGNDGLHY